MKMRILYGGLATLVVLLSSCATPASVKMPESFVIAVQSSKPEETRAAWQPLIDDMAIKYGASIVLKTQSQTQTVEALSSGQADIVWLSSNAAIDAVVDAKAQAFALYYNVNGTNGYKALLVTRAESGISTLDEALTPGKYRYAGGPATSTSGFVLPQHFLFSPRSTTAASLFKESVEGGHFPNLDLLWASKVDLIVNNSTDLAVFQARTPGAKDQLITLWTSPLVPNDVLMARSDMLESKLGAIKALFLNYGKTASERALFQQASGIAYFVPTDNKVLAPVAEFKFATERAQIENNRTLSPESKGVKLAVLGVRQALFNVFIEAIK
jgi:phosphonate transport system substrate-binding protein